VIGASVKIRKGERHMLDMALTCGSLLPHDKASEKGRNTMRKTILTILGLALIAASAAQIAAAAEQKGRRADRVPPPPVSEPFRDANASTFPPAQPYWSRYEGGAISAPAGR
jgi:hypothetical protein